MTEWYVKTQSQRIAGVISSLACLCLWLLRSAPTDIFFGGLFFALTTYYISAAWLEEARRRIENKEIANEQAANPLPTSAPVRAPRPESNAAASIVRTVEFSAPAPEQQRGNGRHIRQLIEAMNSGRVEPTAISLNSLNRAGVTRFNNGGGADSDAGLLLSYLIEKEAIEPHGQAYAACPQPYVWRGLRLEL